MSIRLRSVDGFDDDIGETLKQLHDDCFGDTAPQINPEEGFWWLAYDGREPVAFAGMEASNAVCCAGYLSRSGVRADYRGQGLQLRLIRAREGKARRLGWSLLRTDTTDNPASSNTLIKAGYRLFMPEVPWAFAHSLYWKKNL
jgi:GNAT superfamily N-acetyltransferase